MIDLSLQSVWTVSTRVTPWLSGGWIGSAGRSATFSRSSAGLIKQFEKELIRERTIAGLTSARARGRMGGRKRLLSSQQMRVVKTMWDSRDHTRRDIATHFGVSVPTIDRVLRDSRLVAKSGGGN